MRIIFLHTYLGTMLIVYNQLTTHIEYLSMYLKVCMTKGTSFTLVLMQVCMYV
jgi:hypothetical protein